MTEQPGYPAERILHGLSLSRRIRYAVAGLGGLAVAVLIGTLWATEPAPPPARTQLAFAAVIAVGIAWAVFAAWALASRPLFAADRVIAATLAVVFSAATTVGSVAVAVARSSTPGVAAAAGIGLTLTAAAAVMLVRARAYRLELLARQRYLEEPPASSAAGGARPVRSGLPIGPLALAMRHRRGGSIAAAAIVLALALIAGLALLLVTNR